MHFDFIPLIEKYGYLATFVGTLAEGESLLILCGLAAHRGEERIGRGGVELVEALRR